MLTSPAAAALTRAPLAGRPRTHPPLRVVHPVVRWAFYLFVFSLPFEYPKRTIPWEVTTLTCAAFLLAALLQPRTSFARLPWAVRWFGVYLYVLLGAFVVDGGHYGDQVQKLFTLLLEAVLLLWAASNVLDYEDVARGALVSLGVASALRAAIQLAGIGTERIVEWTGGVRITALGQNENHAAMILSGGIIALALSYGIPARVVFDFFLHKGRQVFTRPRRLAAFRTTKWFMSQCRIAGRRSWLRCVSSMRSGRHAS